MNHRLLFQCCISKIRLMAFSDLSAVSSQAVLSFCNYEVRSLMAEKLNHGLGSFSSSRRGESFARRFRKQNWKKSRYITCSRCNSSLSSRIAAALLTYVSNHLFPEVLCCHLPRKMRCFVRKNVVQCLDSTSFPKRPAFSPGSLEEPVIFRITTFSLYDLVK